MFLRNFDHFRRTTRHRIPESRRVHITAARISSFACCVSACGICFGDQSVSASDSDLSYPLMQICSSHSPPHRCFIKDGLSCEPRRI
jgi:hypothetical protein